jgi:crossover junction endodeoxyribonuclease RuvC
VSQTPAGEIIVGVDPGTAVTGFGVVRRDPRGGVELVECGVVRTRPQAELSDRLRDIFEGVSEVIERHAPVAVAVEGVFYAKNVRTAVVLGHARGVILLAAAQRGVRVAEYPPTEIKTAVAGTGRATKEQVGMMVQRHLRLVEPPRPDDAADAVAAALCHAFTLGRSLPGLKVYPPLTARR